MQKLNFNTANFQILWPESKIELYFIFGEYGTIKLNIIEVKKRRTIVRKHISRKQHILKQEESKSSAFPQHPVKIYTYIYKYEVISLQTGSGPVRHHRLFSNLSAFLLFDMHLWFSLLSLLFFFHNFVSAHLCTHFLCLSLHLMCFVHARWIILVIQGRFVVISNFLWGTSCAIRNILIQHASPLCAWMLTALLSGISRFKAMVFPMLKPN